MHEFHEISLTPFFNLDGVAASGDLGGGTLDGEFAFPAESFRPKGDVPFELPSFEPGAKNCMVPGGQKIDVPEGSYSALFILGTSVLGGSSCELTLDFAEGPASERFRLTDWGWVPQYGERVAARSDFRYGASGVVALPVSLWCQAVFLPPSRKLRSVTFGDSYNMRIFALTLGTASHEPAGCVLLEYLLDRLGGRNKEALEFNTLYRSLMDIYHFTDEPGLIGGLAEIQNELLRKISVEDLFDYDGGKIRAVIDELREPLETIKLKASERLGEGKRKSPLKITLLGHTHLDAVWLWPRNVTLAKAHRTFSRNLERLERYPGVTFCQSTPLFYEWMEEHYPEVFEGIKKQVAAGRWELVGGTWVEPDGYMPTGEAMVRQRLFGQRYFLEKFARLSEVAWIPDTFGMNANHPQIIRKTGGKYFFTTKLMWNYDNEFPYQHFLWEAPDGSRVLALQSPIGCGAPPGPHEGLEESVRKHNLLLEPGASVKVNARSPLVPPELQSDEFIPRTLAIYGEGDGGEGPSDKMFSRAETLAILPEYDHGTAGEHFRLMEEKYGDRLPVWNDELYLENHRGTTTSQGRIKELNRRAEAEILTAEKWSCLNRAVNDRAYPKKDLDRIWKKLLYQQFHDILPGTSVAQVYVDAEMDFEDIFRTSEEIRRGALKDLASTITTMPDAPRSTKFSTGQPLLLFNPLMWERRGTMMIPWGFPGARVIDLDRSEIPCQTIFRDGRHWLLFNVKVPAFGYAQVRIVAGKKPPAVDGVEIDGLKAQNRFYRIELNRDGTLKEIFDKELERNLLSGPANRIQFFKNRPREWSNWNIDPEYEKHELKPPAGGVNIEVIDAGPVVAAFRISSPGAEGGRIVREIRLYRDEKRIDFVTDLDVKYTESLIKAAFPFNAAADFVFTEIPYGVYQRPTVPANAFEKAKWEVWTQKWLDLSGEAFGVTLMTRAKYGFDVKGDRIRLTLVKGGIMPDARTDVFTHRVEYALTSHKGGFRESHAWRKGFEYNFPVAGLLEEEHAGALPPKHSFASTAPDSVCWEAFKPGEEGEGFVIRVYEVEGRDTNATLTLPFQVSKAEEIDFLELERIRDLDAEENRITFSLGHNEIKTLRVFS